MGSSLGTDTVYIHAAMNMWMYRVQNNNTCQEDLLQAKSTLYLECTSVHSLLCEMIIALN